MMAPMMGPAIQALFSGVGSTAVTAVGSGAEAMVVWGGLLPLLVVVLVAVRFSVVVSGIDVVSAMVVVIEFFVSGDVGTELGLFVVPAGGAGCVFSVQYLV